MEAVLTKEEIRQWRSSTERITLEEFAKRLGKSLETKKETNDLHDLMKSRVDNPPEEVVEEKQEKPDFELKISFSKKLNKREEIVFNYFCKNRSKKVLVKELAKLLNLPNDYVYKYIKNLRKKLSNNELLVNADKGGYILKV